MIDRSVLSLTVMEDSHTTMALEAASTHITFIINLDNKQLQHGSLHSPELGLDNL